MNIQISEPESRDDWLALRRPNIGASVIGALLGVHEYTTVYEQWALKSGLVQQDPTESRPMIRGRLLEPVALQLLSEERPLWKITPNPMPGGKYYVDREARIAATPDAFAIDPDRKGFGVVQVKSVESGIFRRKWTDRDTGEITPPLWIAVQAIIEAHLSGASWAVVSPLIIGFGIDVHAIEIPLHPGIVERAQSAAAEFWQMVEAGTPPDADYSRDGELIAEIFSQDDGQTIDLSGDNELPSLLDEREEIIATKKVAETRLKAINTELLAKLGDAAHGRIADGRIISAPTVHRKSYVVPPSSYRAVRIKACASSSSSFSGEF